MVRLPKWCVAVVALAFLVALSVPAFADGTHGKIKTVSADKKEFVLTDADGKDLTFHPADTVRIRLMDKDLTLNDLKAGEEVSVVYDKQGDKLMAHVIRNGEITNGKIKSVSADEKEFVFTDKNGKDWTFRIAADAKIRAADKELKLNELKPGEEVAVIYERRDKNLMALEVCGGRK